MARRVYAFECRYCGEIFKTQYMALRHERACLENPDAVNCTKCIHFQPKYKVKQKDGTVKLVPTCLISLKRCSKAVSSNCEDYKEMEEIENESE